MKKKKINLKIRLIITTKKINKSLQPYVEDLICKGLANLSLVKEVIINPGGRKEG